MSDCLLCAAKLCITQSSFVANVTDVSQRFLYFEAISVILAEYLLKLFIDAYGKKDRCHDSKKTASDTLKVFAPSRQRRIEDGRGRCGRTLSNRDSGLPESGAMEPSVPRSLSRMNADLLHC